MINEQDRQRIMRLRRKYVRESEDWELHGWCENLADDITELINGAVRVNGTCCGHPHSWNVCGGSIIDATATQFGFTKNPVFVTRLDDERYQV